MGHPGSSRQSVGLPTELLQTRRCAIVGGMGTGGGGVFQLNPPAPRRRTAKWLQRFAAEISRYGLGAGLDVEFAINAFDVGAHRRIAHSHPVRDFLVEIAF